MRYFYNGKEITETEAQYLEEFTAARVVQAASGKVPERLGGGDGAWMELKDK